MHSLVGANAPAPAGSSNRVQSEEDFCTAQWAHARNDVNEQNGLYTRKTKNMEKSDDRWRGSQTCALPAPCYPFTPPILQIGRAHV